MASQGNLNSNRLALVGEGGPTAGEGEWPLATAVPVLLPTTKKGKVLLYSLEICFQVSLCPYLSKKGSK